MARLSFLAILAAQAVTVFAVPRPFARSLGTPSNETITCTPADILPNGMPQTFLIDTTGVTLPEDADLYAVVISPTMSENFLVDTPVPHDTKAYNATNDMLIYGLTDNLAPGTYNTECYGVWWASSAPDGVWLKTTFFDIDFTGN
ncbi:hypothetical protein GY45DRAFT_1374521 [Cubamyces sp. BRFM 1775]|nr:hypothetical protein GY45DRAFT_1374521 [Cubamyces sp. BRFM 1775]